MIDELDKKAKQPLVSIIVPMYNASLYIQDTIESILKQTYKNFELIIVDDGSTDDSVQIVHHLLKQDNRIKLLSQENKGAGGARNYGIREAKGKYIRFVDSDDFIPNDSIQKMLDIIVDENFDFVMGSMHFWWNESKHRSPHPHKKIYKNILQVVDPKEKIELGENASCVNKLYKANFLKDNNLFFPEGVIAEDIVFTFSTYFLANKIAIMPENEIIYYWRVREGSVSRSGYSDKYISDRIEITNLMEIVILSNNLEKYPLADRIRKRNVNSILDIIKSNINNFNEKHYASYKIQLLNLKSSGFNIYFNPNNIMKQIIFIILNYSYLDGIEKIKLLLINKKDFHEFIETHSVETVPVSNLEAVGPNITKPTEDKDYYSTWTNTDSLFFELRNLKKGDRIILYIEYSWNSNKTKSSFRSGILTGENIFKIISFLRTKSWTSFNFQEVFLNISKDTEILKLNLRPVNEVGIGFINLKSIKIEFI